jgi:hypothetical protein
LTRPATIEVLLDIGRRQRNARRAAIDNAAKRRSVTFAERGHPK